MIGARRPLPSEFEEKCICDLCECGLHRCPHMASIRLGNEQDVGLSEYESNYTGKYGAAAQPLAQPLLDQLTFKRDSGATAAAAYTLDSTHRADFKAWPVQQAPAIRPIEEYNRPTAAFSASSTHQSDFTRKDLAVEAVKAARSQSTSQWQPGARDQPFTSLSTQQADFDQKIMEPPRPIRPSSVLYKTEEPFDGSTTHKQDYRVFNISTPPSAFKPQDQSRHLSDQPFNATTEHRANFDRKEISTVEMIKPKTSQYQTSNLAMDFKSTYQEGFTDKQKLVEKVDAVRQSDQLMVSREGPFSASTVQHDEFKAKSLKICPAELVLTRRDRSYKHAGVKNGHIMYRRVVRPSVPDLVRYRQMSPVHA